MTVDEIKTKYMADVSTSAVVAARRARNGTDFQSLKEEYLRLGGDPKKLYGTSRQMLSILVDRLKREKMKK
jgi:hypothetical protein